MSVLVENYPFSTIEPNVGIVNLMDPRVKELTNLIKPAKTTYATFRFVDIAGLVKGASQGEGLGNKFLNNIRNVDVICHVVRCFDDPNVMTTTNQIDPLTDAAIIDLELIYADLAVVEQVIQMWPKKMKKGANSQLDLWDLWNRIKQWLQQEKPLYLMPWTKQEGEFLKGYNFLTRKPVLYIGNVNDHDITNPTKNPYFQQLVNHGQKKQAMVVPVAIKMEKDLGGLNDDEANEMISYLGIKQLGLQTIIQASFQLLKLANYFTVGKKEVRAWTFSQGMKADECAGIIHSDFQRGFIRVEVIKYQDFITLKSEQEVKKQGKLMVEGRDYCVQDGDICLFRFNV